MNSKSKMNSMKKVFSFILIALGNSLIIYGFKSFFKFIGIYMKSTVIDYFVLRQLAISILCFLIGFIVFKHGLKISGKA